MLNIKGDIMKRGCIFFVMAFQLSVGMEERVEIPMAKSSKDLLEDVTIQKAISNYFKDNPEVLYPHIVEPLKRKIEESSGEQLDETLSHARDSTDIEVFTQSLITDLLREALEHKYKYDSEQETVKDKNKAKYLLYTAAAGFVSTLTGVLVTYFAKS